MSKLCAFLNSLIRVFAPVRNTGKIPDTGKRSYRSNLKKHTSSGDNAKDKERETRDEFSEAIHIDVLHVRKAKLPEYKHLSLTFYKEIPICNRSTAGNIE